MDSRRLLREPEPEQRQQRRGACAGVATRRCRAFCASVCYALVAALAVVALVGAASSGGLPGLRPAGSNDTPADVLATTYSEAVAKAMVMYAATASCEERTVLESWACKGCRRGAGPIPAPPALTNVSVVRSEDAINQGIVGYDPVNDRVVVAFRGSVSLSQWIFDVDVRLRKVYAELGCQSCYAHEGFFEAFEELREPVFDSVKALREAFGTSKVWLTGHSLGGAMAAHAGLELLARDASVNVTGYTFGQPRLGNKALAAWSRSRLPSWIRVVNFLDPVVQCVKLPGYHHMPTEVWYFDKPKPGAPPGRFRVCSSLDGEDKTCQDARCGGFKLCLDGSNHVSYMNLEGITNTSLLC